MDEIAYQLERIAAQLSLSNMLHHMELQGKVNPDTYHNPVYIETLESLGEALAGMAEE